MRSPKPSSNEPYCSNCGYVLTGLTESSKCPECGRPIVDVLVRPQTQVGMGKRWRSRARLLGLPLIDVALGPAPGEFRGKARGILAIGDVAAGGVAIGGVAGGVVAIGGMALGLFSIGGLSIGLISALGGLAVGAMAAGGGAVGVLAQGGGAAGVVAQGGGAVGLHARDGRTPVGAYDPIFDQLNWFFGGWPPVGGGAVGMLVPLALAVSMGAAIAMLVWLRYQSEPGRESSGQEVTR